jgi:hypothetical protein
MEERTISCPYRESNPTLQSSISQPSRYTDCAIPAPTIQCRTVVWRMMKWKEYDRKRSWPNPGTFPAFALRDCVKPRKTQVRIGGDSADTRTRNLPNTSSRNLPGGGEGRSASKADNLTAIYEPTVYKMWEPRRLTILWTSTVC